MFCPNCGTDAGNAAFCSGCGNRMGAAAAPAPAAPAAAMPAQAAAEVKLWEGKPSGLADKAKGKLNSAEYKVTNQRIIIRSGLIGKKETEIDLKHIKDIEVKQSIADRLAKVGDIHLKTSDPTSGDVTLDNVQDPFVVKEIIRKALTDYRAGISIQYREDI